MYEVLDMSLNFVMDGSAKGTLQILKPFNKLGGGKCEIPVLAFGGFITTGPMGITRRSGSYNAGGTGLSSA